jgi:hypothetical protein
MSTPELIADSPTGDLVDSIMSFHNRVIPYYPSRERPWVPSMRAKLRDWLNGSGCDATTINGMIAQLESYDRMLDATSPGDVWQVIGEQAREWLESMGAVVYPSDHEQTFADDVWVAQNH